MTIQRMIELLEIEHECILRAGHDDCDRNCADCDLVQDDGDLHEMYTDVIALLKEQEAKEQCLKTKCVICPHCDHCDVDENGQLKEQEEQIKTRDESLEKAREEIKWLRGMLKEQEAVVRCKDCKYGRLIKGMIFCHKRIPSAWMLPDWFCADGRKKDG